MTGLAEAVAVGGHVTRGRPIYLALEPDAVFAMHHAADGPGRSTTGVLICSPFGWDEIFAHRSLMAWADAAADAGHDALRFDYPGSGDSGGSPRDPRRLDAWTDAVTRCADWLRANRGCEHVVAIGIGLGGMVACRAAALDAPIDDLVLWGVPARGRRLVRELRTLARMVEAGLTDISVPGRSEQAEEEPEAAGEDGGDLNAAGFVLTAETVADLEGLNLAALAVPRASERRVLMFGRDTLAPDPRLREHLERAGAEVTLADGAGYGTMMVDPQFSIVPDAVLERSLAWIDERSPGRGATAGEPARASAPVGESGQIELRVGDETVRETPFEFDYRGRRLFGILTEPVSVPAAARPQLCAVLPNSGALRHIGPHRMWVEIARRWASLGVPTLRYDIVAVGDSDGDEAHYRRRAVFFDPEFQRHVVAALDALERHGLPNRFLIGGLCAGAYWSLHVALDDPRVRGLFLFNLVAFQWGDELGARRDVRRVHVLLAERDVRTIVRIIVTQPWRIARMARAMLLRALPRRRPGGPRGRRGSDAVRALDRLRERDVATLLVLALEEPLYDEFVVSGLIERIDQWPNLTVDRIDTNEHVFRPLWCQRHLHDAIDGLLDRMLEADRAAPR